MNSLVKEKDPEQLMMVADELKNSGFENLINSRTESKIFIIIFKEEQVSLDEYNNF